MGGLGDHPKRLAKLLMLLSGVLISDELDIQEVCT